MDEVYFSHLYTNSRALVIGINKYAYAPPLDYAVNDATEVADILSERFDFPKDNIKILTDETATRDAIMSSFLSYANDNTEPDDRILVFFAGHGFTKKGKRGEIGYLVPQDGKVDALSTLIRWDELTRNADLISAKHILFIMDACYGGLAIPRKLSPGSMRFLKDMLQRYARQVLTAGKANEEVADSNGPIPNHSIFTGYFLKALNGEAASKDGIITANGVMSYVYERVAKDRYSQQTPHYGFIDGDGDFIFNVPELSSETGKGDKDILIEVPASMPVTNEKKSEDIISLTKEYLSENRSKIKLHDLVAQKLRELIANLSDNRFSVQNGIFSPDELMRRMKLYEDTIYEIQMIITCVAYWGNSEHHQILNKILARVSDNMKPQSGLKVWIELQWYPVILLIYSAGIAAIAAKNYDALREILNAKVQSPRSEDKNTAIALSVDNAISELHDVFKAIPKHENFYVSRSEYLFKLLQPSLDDLLFLGRDYERMFDYFEAFLALVCADMNYEGDDSFLGGPLGRFAWKYRRQRENGFSEIINEAKSLKNEWLPFKAGLFSGSFDRFIQISFKLEERLKKLSWY